MIWALKRFAAWKWRISLALSPRIATGIIYMKWA
jgi:hypothetical protein